MSSRLNSVITAIQELAPELPEGIILDIHTVKNGPKHRVIISAVAEKMPKCYVVGRIYAFNSRKLAMIDI